jgi:lipoprotein-releasing system ATP-binding protein
VEVGTSLLTARGLVKTYPSGIRRLRVLDGTNLDVDAGEWISIVGASGVGKSTLLHLLAGLDTPDDGVIELRGRRLDGLAEVELAQVRNAEIGMVFQFYHLLPDFTAHENVMMPLLIARRPADATARAAALLEQVGLAERGHHFPTELSGGERQRVAIARALATEPALVLADEPTGNLDHEAGRRIMELFRALRTHHRAALVMVTHNRELARGFDRVLTMLPGGHLEPVAD